MPQSKTFISRDALVIIRSIAQRARAGQERDALNEIAMHANAGIRDIDSHLTLKERVMLWWRKVSYKRRITERQRPPGSLITDVKNKAAEGFVIGWDWCPECSIAFLSAYYPETLEKGDKGECHQCHKMVCTFTKIDDLDNLV